MDKVLLLMGLRFASGPLLYAIKRRLALSHKVIGVGGLSTNVQPFTEFDLCVLLVDAESTPTESLMSLLQGLDSVGYDKACRFLIVVVNRYTGPYTRTKWSAVTLTSMHRGTGALPRDVRRALAESPVTVQALCREMGRPDDVAAQATAWQTALIRL